MLSKVSNSQEENIIGAEKEQIQLAWTALTAHSIVSRSTITDSSFESALTNNGNNVTVSSIEDNTFLVNFADTNNAYTIDKNGNIVFLVDGAPLIPTDIYVTLYSDGTLAFCNNTDKISGKTVSVEYGNIKNQIYTNTISLNDRIPSTPWANNVTQIQKVNFVSEIIPTSTSNWFCHCTALTTFENMENLNTSRVTKMDYMFSDCFYLTEIDLSNFNTSSVTDMTEMFSRCLALEALDLSSFDVSNVVSMQGMFAAGNSDTSPLKTIKGIENFDTKNVENMYAMFWNCTELTTLDLSRWNTAKVESMGAMFGGNQRMRFSILNLSGFNTSNVTNMRIMFNCCSSLIKVYVGNGWNTNNVTNDSNMFYDCKSLVGEIGTLYNSSKTDRSYARIDANNQPGYFSTVQQNLASNNTELEYIESTGTQYIDTGVYATINTKLEIETMITDSRTDDIWAQITGAGSSYHASSAIQVAYNPKYNYLAIDYGTNGTNFGNNANYISINTKYTIKIQNNNHYINNTVGTNNGSFSGRSSYSLWIFDENYAGNSVQRAKVRIYSYKIYEGNTKIRDFVPVHNSIANCAGLYDKVQGIFYPNIGTTAFSEGPAKQ